MYCLLVRDALNEYAYDAEISGLEYDLYSYGRGLLVEVAGYSHKLPILLEKVLSKMRDIEIREDRFNVLQERIMRGLKNWDFIQPYSQVGDHLRHLNEEKHWMNTEELNELEGECPSSGRC
jgi:insulysin